MYPLNSMDLQRKNPSPNERRGELRLALQAIGVLADLGNGESGEGHGREETH